MNGFVECITVTAAITAIIRFSFKCFKDCYDEEDDKIIT